MKETPRERLRAHVAEQVAKSGSGAVLVSAATVHDLFGTLAALRDENERLRADVETYGDAYDKACERACDLAERAEAAEAENERLREALREAATMRAALCRNSCDEDSDPMRWDKPLQRWNALLYTEARDDKGEG